VHSKLLLIPAKMDFAFGCLAAKGLGNLFKFA
jgi:hypothetical protein